MDEVCTMLKKLHFNYNKCRNKEIVTFINEICMLPYLEEVFRKNENGWFFFLKKKK